MRECCTAVPPLLVTLLTVSACSPNGSRAQERSGSSFAPLVWTEEGKLTAAAVEADDHAGTSVALSGDTALVGADWDDDNGGNSGSAYVFVRSASSWSQQDKLTAGDGNSGDLFGISVEVDGDTALVGASNDDDDGEQSGSAYVFARDASTWSQQVKLTADDAETYSMFGCSLSLSGDTALVGADWDDDNGGSSGSAYVFVRSASSWSQQDKLIASDGAVDDHFGYSVSVSDVVALVGSYHDSDDGSQSGSAYVFVRSASSWIEAAKLTASDAAASDRFGSAVSIHGETGLVGAPNDDDNGTSSGSVYVFVRNANSVTEQAKLTASSGEAGDQFGNAVSLHGDTALVGAHTETANDANGGAAYLFVRSAASWSEQQRLTAGDGAADDRFGTSVSCGSDTTLVGAPNHDDQGEDSGTAYVYALRSEDGDPCTEGAGCASGHCVDSVCCESDCGGGDPDDCQACSIADGSTADGVCGIVADDAACDDGQFCNGTETCTGGVCGSSTGDPCATHQGDDDMDCSEGCNEEADDCTADDPDGVLCTAGGTCHGGNCILPSGAPCTDDVHCSTTQCVDDVCCAEPDCTPYRCGPGGVCRETCGSAAACAPGYTCNAAHQCVTPQAAPVEDGCGCRLPARPSRLSPGLVAVLGLALGLRRRRHPTRPWAGLEQAG